MNVFACPKTAIVVLFLILSCSELSYAKELKSVLPSGCGQVGSFTQRSYIVGIEQPLLSSGKFIFDCQHGLVWVQSAPVSEAVAYSLKGKVFIERDNNMDMLRQRHHKEMGRLLNKIFSSDESYLEKRFSVTPFENDDSILLLEPKSARYKKVFSNLTLKKDERGALITIVLKNGERRELQLKELEQLSEVTKQGCVRFIEPFQLVCSELFNKT